MKRPLLLFLAHAEDGQRFAVGPGLAALAHQAGWAFDCSYDALRDGRHFGGGDLTHAGPTAGNGSLVAGGSYAEQLLWLTAAYDVVALGDPGAIAWPVLAAAGAETLCRSTDPADIYEAAITRMQVDGPAHLLVVDGAPQGRHRVIAAPYLLPAVFVDGPALVVDVAAGAGTVNALVALLRGDTTPPTALYVDPQRADAFAVELSDRQGSVGDATYAEVTAELQQRHAGWGRGILLGDPHLVAAHAPKAARLHLVPLYGKPQVDVLTRTDAAVRAATEPVYGRQYDDRDFFALARAGHGLQVIDPTPPFDSASTLVHDSSVGDDRADEPHDDQLARWADEGRVLTTLLFWGGMIREAECYPPILDLLAATGLRAGIVVTVDSVRHLPPSSLSLLAEPVDRGGVGGLAELLVGSTGFGVAAESDLPAGVLASSLERAREELADVLPSALQPRGWWPLLDTSLQPHRTRMIGRKGRRPVVRYTLPSNEKARALIGGLLWRTHAYPWFEERRPYDHVRPGALLPSVAEAVRDAGFEYMWTKAGFGSSEVVHADGAFVALPFTAGNWDGWSPFFTVSSLADVVKAERGRKRVDRPGWLVSTIDTPLWLLSGERQRASWLHAVAERLVAGGTSGRLVNATPGTIARYARLLEERRADRPA